MLQFYTTLTLDQAYMARKILRGGSCEQVAHGLLWTRSIREIHSRDKRMCDSTRVFQMLRTPSRLDWKRGWSVSALVRLSL